MSARYKYSDPETKRLSFSHVERVEQRAHRMAPLVCSGRMKRVFFNVNSQTDGLEECLATLNEWGYKPEPCKCGATWLWRKENHKALIVDKDKHHYQISSLNNALEIKENNTVCSYRECGGTK